MNAEPIRYMVACDHPERCYFVADIDDHRPSGGTVHLRLYRGGVATRVAAANKLGSRRSIPFRCGACSRNVELEETSLPEVLDKIAPHRAALSVDDDGRYVIGLDTLCHIVTKLR